MQSKTLKHRKSVALRRRGAAIVEGAIVALTMLVVLLGMLDLAIAVIRYNALSEGVRRVARAAIVHGADASPEANAWGPAAFAGSADSQSEICAAIRPALVGIDPAEVDIDVAWIDGGNSRGQRVQVTASHSYRPVVPFILGGQAIELSAQSTMIVMH